MWRKPTNVVVLRLSKRERIETGAELQFGGAKFFSAHVQRVRTARTRVHDRSLKGANGIGSPREKKATFGDQLA
jgi:hypothetical protein